MSRFRIVKELGIMGTLLKFGILGGFPLFW
jgi:hypothetical protein